MNGGENRRYFFGGAKTEIKKELGSHFHVGAPLGFFSKVWYLTLLYSSYTIFHIIALRWELEKPTH